MGTILRSDRRSNWDLGDVLLEPAGSRSTHVLSARCARVQAPVISSFPDLFFRERQKRNLVAHHSALKRALTSAQGVV